MLSWLLCHISMMRPPQKIISAWRLCIYSHLYHLCPFHSATCWKTCVKLGMCMQGERWECQGGSNQSPTDWFHFELFNQWSFNMSDLISNLILTMQNTSAGTDQVQEEMWRFIPEGSNLKSTTGWVRANVMRSFRSCNVCSKILHMLHQSADARVLFYAVVCWSTEIKTGEVTWPNLS